jgi:hypothetical protein
MNSKAEIKSYGRSNIPRLAALLFVTIILVLAAIFRPPGFDADYDNYDYSIRYFSNLVYWDTKEPFYYIAIKISTFSALYPTVVFMACYAVVAIPLKMYFINKNSEKINIIFALVVYLYLWFPLHDLNQVRAGAAVAFLLLSIDALSREKFLSFIIFVLAATCFHYNSLIFFFGYILSIGNYRKIYVILPLISFTLMLLNLDQIFINLFLIILSYTPFMGKVDLYLNSSIYGNIGEINKFNLFYIFLMTTFYYRAISSYQKFGFVNLSLYDKFFSFGISIFYLFSSVSIFSFRTSELFLTASIYSLSDLNIFSSNVGKIIYLILLFIVLNVYFATKILGEVIFI